MIKLIYQFKYLLFASFLTISIVINYIFIVQIRRLEGTIAYISTAGNIKAGDTVGPLELKNWRDGKHQLINFNVNQENQGTIFYYFSPSCIWCDRNLTNMKQLYEKTSQDYQFISLTTSDKGLKEYVESKNIAFPVYIPVDFNSFKAYAFGGTPQTLVVSSSGTVLASWQGAYVDDNKKAVEEFFKINLPGVTEVVAK